MSNLLKLVLVVVAFAMPNVALAQTDDVTGSKHDFTTANGPNTDFQGAASECVTCHIPHGADTTKLIWNHTLSADTLSFGTGADTSSGTQLPTDVGASPGTSKYCLSCHDGTIAVGDMINGTDWGTNTVSGIFDVVGTGGDMDGNHPIEIPYPDQAGATYNSVVTAADSAQYVASPTGVKLIGGTAGAKGIGCASCHNPHNDTNTFFLRVSEATLCQSCHIK